MIIKREDNESKLDYIKRVTKGKRDKTLDIDYTEWAECVYGQPYSTDVARRIFYGVERLLEVIQEEKVNTNVKDIDILKEIENEKLELQKERKKLLTLNAERNKSITKESRFELLFESIYNCIERVEQPVFLGKENNETNTKEHILTITDIHYGSDFKSTNNFYNIEECHRRFNVLLNECVDFVLTNRVTKLKVLNLGDSIQGILRLSDLRLNEVSVIESVIGVSKCLIAFLSDLSKYCEVEYIHVGEANHSQIRPLGSKASELKSEDLERLIANYVATGLENNTKIKIPLDHLHTDRVEFEMCGFNFICLHGHQIKNINTAINDLSMLHRKFYDVVMLGHFHGGMTKTCGEGTTNLEVIVAPSFIGSDPYSDFLMVGAKSMCQIHTYQINKGHVQVNNIKLN